MEFAVILPLFIGLLFSIIEFGFMFRNQLIVQQAAREGARHAALGKTTGEITARVQASMVNLPLDRLTIVQEYRTLSGTTWSSWSTLGNTTTDPVTNNAPQGAQVRVRLTFTHRLLTGPLFARMIGQPGATSVNLHSQMVMRRE
ncbi:MAG: pilus assembly protein [Armatimonadetes bacterium]|nr:pilus assembly protein [Armatimonadota bacterium]